MKNYILIFVGLIIGNIVYQFIRGEFDWLSLIFTALGGGIGLMIGIYLKHNRKKK